MTPSTMRAARLHGIRDLRVEELPVPEPGPGDLLVRVEACGICPTDARKFEIGVNDGGYPLNPGHEWVGTVVATGDGVEGHWQDRRVYGDTYAGYAEYALIGAAASGWSGGALEVGDISVERAVFVEPLADCLHAVHDQGGVRPGDLVVVLGAGAMGLQLVAAAAGAGGRVLAVEPRDDRRRLAAAFGADQAVDATGWSDTVTQWTDGAGPSVVIVSVASAPLAAEAVNVCAPGGRVVLFAGFGDAGRAELDLNRLHYLEIALVGSEWIGVPPRQRLERYADARELLREDRVPVERLVSDATGLDGVDEALRAVREQRSLKTILYPGEVR
jgi:L-iditol 2-dehydrogenase